MGGKSKQRTKNNVRPSSSGRSAQLLHNVQFDTGMSNIGSSELPALFPSLVVPSIDPLISPELQMCLKKLNKKDPITKTKALQELSELVGNSKLEDVVAVLPTWAHLYKTLTADPDRKVREYTQACQGRLASACGRRLAPVLRQLLPAWLHALKDDHAPAQALAQASLAKTFPENKLPEVISFCLDEVMAHIVDNLLGPGEANYIRKTDEPEAAAATAARVAAGSLHALQQVVRLLPAARAAALWPRLAALLDQRAYWARARHADCRVRESWYGAAGALAERFGAQFGEHCGARALREMLSAREQRPRAAAQLWDSLLLFMDHVKDWHKYLDQKELLVKRILDMLENGGWGEARHLPTVLLPLLSHLPPPLATAELYSTFFEAMLKGLLKKSILNSKSERQSWITCLDECLRYLSIQTYDFVPEVVSCTHRSWLQTVLSPRDKQTRDGLVKVSGAKMAALVKYWLRQAGTDNRYDQMIRNFWLNVGAVASSQIDNVSLVNEEIASLLDGHILLLQTLKISFAQDPKKRLGITFEDEPRDAVEESPTKEEPCDATVVERYNHNLNDVVHKICCRYFEFANKTEISEPILSPLLTLLEDFDTKVLFEAISRQFDCDSIYDWYSRVLRTWLTGDTMRCKTVVDIVFMILKYLTEEQQDALLDSFKQCPPAVVQWCLSAGERGARRGVRAARAWLRAPAGGAAAAALCARLARRPDAPARDLLLRLLRPADGGEAALSPEAAERCVRLLCEAAAGAGAGAGEGEGAEEGARELCAGALGELGAAPLAPHLRALLALHSYTLLLDDRPPAPPLPGAARAGLRACAAGGAALQPAARRELLARCAARARARLPLLEPTLDIPHMEYIVSQCPALLPPSPHYPAEVSHLSRHTLDFAPIDPSLVELYATRHDIVTGVMTCPIPRDVISSIIDDVTQPSVPEMTREDFIKYANVSVFRALYLKTVLLHKPGGDDDESRCDQLLEECLMEELCTMLHDYMVVRALFKAYGFWLHYSLIEETKNKLDELIEAITRECSDTTRQHTLDALSKLAESRGFYWPFAKVYFESLCRQIFKDETDNKNSKSEMENENNDENVDENKNIDNRKDSSEKSDTESDTEISDNNAEKSDTCTEKAENSDESELGNKNKEDSEPDDEESEKEQARSQSEIDRILEKYVKKFSESNIEDIIKDDGLFHSLEAQGQDLPESSQENIRYYTMLRCLLLHRPPLERLPAGRALLAPDPDLLVNAYYNDNAVMLYEMDVSCCAWAAAARSAAAARQLAAAVRARGARLPAHLWDFATISLCSLAASVERTKRHWFSTKVAMLGVSVLRLYVAVQSFIASVPAECEKRQPLPHVAHLPHEWADIFAPDLHYNLFSIIVYILETRPVTPTTSNHIAFLHELIACVGRMKWASLTAAQRNTFSLERLQRAAAGALQDDTPLPYKMLAYSLADIILEPLVELDSELVCSRAEQSQPPRLWLARWAPAFEALRERAAPPLQPVPVCEQTCAPEPGSELFALAAGWLLLLQLLYRQAQLATGDLAQHYIRLYRDHKWTECALEFSLRLIPEEILASALEGDEPLAGGEELFYAAVSGDLYRAAPAGLQALACGAVRACVRGPGRGAARAWLARAARPARALLALAELYISPRAVRDELDEVLRDAADIEDAEVCVHRGAREVTCALRLEAVTVRLELRLARAHPLAPAAVEAGGAPLAADVAWLRLLLERRHAGAARAVRAWAAALARRLERAPHCYVCYCRLHAASAQLPRARCRTCRNAFHSACLRKWFKTSTKTNCPICRTPF